MAGSGEIENLERELGDLKRELRIARSAHQNVSTQPQTAETETELSLPPIDLSQQHQLARRLNLVQRADHYFFVDVVGTCNLRCPSCAVGNYGILGRKGLMSLPTYSEILKKIRSENPDHKRLFVDLYNWGEPGLHPDLSKFVAMTKELGMGVGLSSNLNVFPNLRDTIKAEPDYLRISLSGSHNETYQKTHKRGDIFAVKSNMYKIRHLLDRYRSNTVIDVGFHIYRSNFPSDFLAIRSLCDELGFLFAPVIATILPAEKVLQIADGMRTNLDKELLENLVLPVDETLELFRKTGEPTPDCQFRQHRTTINFDGSVALCCAVYEPDKTLLPDFLSASREKIERQKYAHDFCRTCMSKHVNKLYIGYERETRQQRAISVLGPLFEQYIEERRLLGQPDYLVVEGRFEKKDAVYERAMAALSQGERGWEETEACLDALIDGAPDFGEGFFQAGAMAMRRKNYQRASELLEEATHLAPDNANYAQALKDAQAMLT